MKTYVLILSKTFPKGHPKEGRETFFAEAFRRGITLARGICSYSPKIHTIRANYELWKKRIDEVNAGNAVLSVRQWTGKPLRSKQVEIYRFDKDSGIGVERIVIESLVYYISEDAKFTVQDSDPVTRKEVAQNDGLSEEDWISWFTNGKYVLSEPMAIIHFTKFRYCN